MAYRSILAKLPSILPWAVNKLCKPTTLTAAAAAPHNSRRYLSREGERGDKGEHEDTLGKYEPDPINLLGKWQEDHKDNLDAFASATGMNPKILDFMRYNKSSLKISRERNYWTLEESNFTNHSTNEYSVKFGKSHNRNSVLGREIKCRLGKRRGSMVEVCDERKQRGQLLVHEFTHIGDWMVYKITYNRRPFMRIIYRKG